MTSRVLTNYIVEAVRRILEDKQGLSYASLVAPLGG
jgi:hypothetical protein